ncbi:hypothetical protein CsSME_00035959 [Camellia sinensis var. sinensis]
MIRRDKLCKQTLENTLSLLCLLSIAAGQSSHQWPAAISCGWYAIISGRWPSAGHQCKI